VSAPTTYRGIFDALRFLFLLILVYIHVIYHSFRSMFYLINNLSYERLRKLDKLRKQIKTIQEELERLSAFRETQAQKKFQRQLRGESSVIKESIRKLSLTTQDKEQLRKHKQKQANKNRSSKNKRSWNYVKSIRGNYFPDKSVKEIRSALKRHRQGLETDIPDVAWRNPSP